MHKSFIITEEDKNRILGMHENATKRQYLGEQAFGPTVPGTTNPFQKTSTQTTGCIDGDCKNGTGTYIVDNGSKYVGQFKDKNFNGQGTYTWPNGDKYVGQFKDDKFNGRGSYKNLNGYVWIGDFKDGNPVGTDWETIVGKEMPTWKPELENCLKSSGGRKDEQGVYWVTNKEGKWGYYPDGRYHKDGSNNWGDYYCDNDKISYSKTPPNTSTPLSTLPSTPKQTYKIPSQLGNKDGVIKFQTWLEKYHKGWYEGNKPIDGNFGNQTNVAWGTYKNDYLDYIKKGYDKYTSPDVSQGIDQGN